MHHLRDLRQENQTALLKNLIIMQMSFFSFYLTLLNSPYGNETAQRKTQGDLTLGNRPHKNSPICGQLTLCVSAHTGKLSSIHPCPVGASSHIAATKPNYWSPEEWWLLLGLDWWRCCCWLNLCSENREDHWLWMTHAKVQQKKKNAFIFLLF